MGLTSMLYWSLGMLPFKDAFWTETDEPGNEWAPASEADPELETVVSAVMAGPVGPSDALGLFNRTRIMRTCSADGTLLKPKAPAMNVDATFTAAARSWDGANNALGLAHIWAAPMGPAAAVAASAAGSGAAVHDHFVALFANITSAAGASFGMADLSAIGDAPAGSAPRAGYVAREFYSGRVARVNSSSKLEVAAMTKPASCSGAG